jgi:hypothetical protein
VDVEVVGVLAFVPLDENGIQIFDVRDPTRPFTADRMRTATAATSVAAAGDLVLAITWRTGMLVLSPPVTEIPRPAGELR